MQTTDKFFESFKKAGHTRLASWTPSAGGPAQTADVLYRAPGQDVLQGEAFATAYTIRYPATKFPGLIRGETVTIDAVNYKVKEDPRSELDGTRMLAHMDFAP
jgi:hypothetical protein